MKKTMLLACLLLATGMQAKKGGYKIVNLVPETPSQAPDYMCTWNLQGYAVSYTGSNNLRLAMNEEYIFGQAYGQRWVNMFPEIHQDLWFLLDDSWDIPKDDAQNNSPKVGLDELDESRFPSFKGTPTERFRHLSDSLKAYGWRGLGLWVSAQKAACLPDVSDEDFWTNRLQVAEAAGVGYWKIDWGRQSKDHQWRRWLSEKARREAPHLTVEQAMNNANVVFSDTYRTYDVENIIAQPITIDRVCQLLPYEAEAEAKGIVNCEDEPYIAAGLGCAIGVMRHPYAGVLPSGRDDEAFPATVRDLKRRLDEVIRAVRWHRIAQPFGVDGDYQKDTQMLEDFWTYKTGESWVRHKEGEAVKGSAPARISRRMPLPVVKSEDADRPYVLASRYPNGAVAVAAIGRTLDRSYIEKEVEVEVEVQDLTAPLGIFGYFQNVTFNGPTLRKKNMRVFAQDLKGNRAVNVTKLVTLTEKTLTVPADVIRRVGLMFSAPGDKSAPGLVIQLK